MSVLTSDIPVGAIYVVICTECDDYTSPRGRQLPSGRQFRFAGSAYGHVREGAVYAVDADGDVVAPMLDQDCRGARRWRTP